MYQDKISINTQGRGITEITSHINTAIRNADCEGGLCNVFLHHTSASLIISENADPDVLGDLETYFSELVQDGDPRFVHRAEGPDDMAAHIRSVLTSNSINIPIQNGQLDLGTWQGVFLWEHRYHAHQRSISLTVVT